MPFLKVKWPIVFIFMHHTQFDYDIMIYNITMYAKYHNKQNGLKIKIKN